MQTENLKLKAQNCAGRILIAAAITLCVLSGTAWPLGNTSVGNPIGPGTVPASSISSGLIRSPNPIDSSGNLVITGNVARGKYFRGPIPYGSTTGFRAPLGSTSLDSFLRDSTSSDDFDRYLERYRVQPYYSPTGTVTTMTPGSSSVSVPSSTRIVQRAPEALGPEGAPAKEISAGQNTSVSGVKLPSIQSQQQVEKLGLEKIAGRPQTEGLTSEQYEQQMEQLRLELQRIKNRTDELKQKLEEKDESLQIPPEIKQGEIVGQPPDMPGMAETEAQAQQKQAEVSGLLTPVKPLQKQEQPGDLSKTGKERTQQGDVYEQIKQQIDRMQASQEKEKTAEITGQSSEPTYGLSASKGQLSKEKSSLEALIKRQPSTQDTYSKMEGATGVEGISEEKIPSVEEVQKLSPKDLSAEARRVMGPHKDIESLSEAKFNQYMLAAQTYLKEGKFYRAADSYALASMYKKNDPAAESGRGQASFAAGEYISSALFISRAIEISAEYAKTKVDLVSIFGDKVRLESRIADVEEWHRKSNSPELEFLLGYIYYQTGRPDLAKKAIEPALEKKPQWPALQALKKVVDEAIAAPK